MKARLAVLLIVTVLGVGACVNQPTTPSATGANALFDGGLGFGSGNRTGQDSTTQTNATASSGSNSRGGLGLGSGN